MNLRDFGQRLIPTGERSGLQPRISGDRKRFVVPADEKLTAPVGGRIFLTLIHNGDV